MQSGKAGVKRWVLEMEPEIGRFIEPIMGWTGSDDTKQQLKLRFETKEEAIAYATKRRFEADVEEPNLPAVKPKSYADNFLK
jgi:hypothetical protein